MFTEKLLHSGAAGASRQLVNRSIALAQTDDRFNIGRRQEFSEPPDTTFVCRVPRNLALTPGLLQGIRIGGMRSTVSRSPGGIENLQQIAARETAKILLRDVRQSATSDAAKGSPCFLPGTSLLRSSVMDLRLGFGSVSH